MVVKRPVLPESTDPACGYSLPPVWAGPHKKKDLSAPYAGRKGLFCISKDVVQASVNTLAMIFHPSEPFFRAWKST